MDCRVTLVQSNPRLGDVHANLDAHLACVDSLAEESDLIVFPELSLTGYFLKDQVLDLGLERDSEPLRRLAHASRRVSLMVGFVERTPEGRFYNAAAFLEDGELKALHRKVHLVSYGLFEEGRDFAPGDAFRVIASKHGRFGPLICEDAWHAPSAYQHFLNHADALIVMSASPARGVERAPPGASAELGSQRTWDTLLGAQALLYRTYVLYASRVGWEDGVGFAGGSAVYSPEGAKTSCLLPLEPGELRARLTSTELHRARFATPLRRDEKPEILLAELARHMPCPGLETSLP